MATNVKVSHPLFPILWSGDACPGDSREMLTRSAWAGILEEERGHAEKRRRGGLEPAQTDLQLLCEAGTHTVCQREGDPD